MRAAVVFSRLVPFLIAFRRDRRRWIVVGGPARRTRAWGRLASDLDPRRLEAATEVVPLSGILPYADRILAGRVQGRIVVDVNQ